MMSIKFSISVFPSIDPAFVRRIVPEFQQTGHILRRDITFLRAHLGDGIQVRQAHVLHAGLRHALHALLHAVGEDAHHAQHLSARFPQGLHGFQHAAAGGDQILHDHDLLALVQTALDAVLAAVVLIAGADVAHGQAQQVGGNGGVGDTGGGGAHQDLRLRILPLHGIGDGLLHLVPGFRSGEDQPVIAVDGALDAAGPGKGLLRAEKDRLDLQQTLGNAHMMLSIVCSPLYPIFLLFQSFPFRRLSPRTPPRSGGRQPRGPPPG